MEKIGIIKAKPRRSSRLPQTIGVDPTGIKGAATVIADYMIQLVALLEIGG
jgi:hypothetical protein